MAPSSNHHPKVQLSKPSAKGRRNKNSESSTTIPPHAKELPLRTSLVRDSVKKRIFAYMDKGDRSADIELKSGLSHPRVKHYRRMWKDERHDRRLRSKKRLRRKVRRSDEPIQLPLRSKPACGQELESSQVATSGGEKGKRKHRVARGLKERKANARTEDARSRLPESIGMQLKPADYPHGVENQLVIRLHEKPTH